MWIHIEKKLCFTISSPDIIQFQYKLTNQYPRSTYLHVKNSTKATLRNFQTTPILINRKLYTKICRQIQNFEIAIRKSFALWKYIEMASDLLRSWIWYKFSVHSATIENARHCWAMCESDTQYYLYIVPAKPEDFTAIQFLAFCGVWILLMISRVCK